jgi:uracil-DNA glycosylase family 4
MQGFFTSEELEDRIQVEFDFDEGPNCSQCGLFRTCHSPKMKYTGEGKKGVLIVAESPGQNEDIKGVQLIGEAGQLLRNELKKLKLDLDQDFWKMNAISCRPITRSGANRPPTKAEIKFCKPLVDKTISELKPSMIWLMGGVAVESFYGDRFSKLAINRWRKLCIPDRKTGAWIIPLFHPSYINRQSHDENLRAVFERDLKWAASCIKKQPFEFTDERKDVTCLYDFDQITRTLEEILLTADIRKVQLYIDYETNSLKPQWPGAKIATISFCPDSTKKAIAFPYQYGDFFTAKQQMKIKALWRKICQHTQISLLAHNMKFEDAWTRNIFGVRPYSWQWDTMIAAHILDNRSNFTGLKFQSYVNFGLEPYNKDIDKYLKAKSGHFNSVDKAPLDQLLLYNGLDTIMGMKLYEKQCSQFQLTDKLSPKNKLSNAYQLFHQGILALSDVQQNGICIDEEYYKEQNLQITERIETLKTELMSSEEATQFRNAQGKEIDLGSPKDLGILFYEVLQLPAQKTDKDNYRVDVDALDSIKIPFVEKLIQMRKMEKAKGTYIAQLLREVCGGRIHPFIDLHVPVTYRSSSQSPNFQNVPIRDPEIGPLIRNGIVPSPGNRIMEADYSSIEVRIAAVYTNDPILIAQATTDGADMHVDSAMSMWMLSKEEVSKPIRQDTKGNINFAFFYGSFYKQCAVKLWKQLDLQTNSGITLREHMQTKGIQCYADFEEHCRQFEDDFWNKRFYTYKQWKEDINAFYRKHGYIESKLGFRFVTSMNEREVSNYLIQSTAFHCLLTSLIILNNISKQEKWKSKIIGQIHDSLIYDLYPEEEDHIFKTCSRVMSEEIRERYPWITVPIPVEIEVSPQNSSWWSKKEIKSQ